MLKKLTISFMAVSAIYSCILLNSTSQPVYADITANPIISRDCPVYSKNSQSASFANDAFYYSFWTDSSPSYLAYDLSAVPEEQREKVIAVWYNATGNYDYTVVPYYSPNSVPTSYTIEVNDAEGGAYPEENWIIAETVTENTCHSRQHIIDMKGYNWIRINIYECDNKADGSVSINFDIHDVSDGISDSWIFFGDSITAGGMMNCYGTGFAELINQIDSRYFPVQENGGIGGIFSTDGRNNIDRWLEQFCGKYVSIAYGTNDSWGNQTGAEKYYENTAYMVEKIIESGKIPVIPKIPYATESGVNTYLSEYNAMIDKIYANYPEVIKGPDFEKLFYDNPELLSSDGVHPNSEGYSKMRELWAEIMYESVYKSSDADLKGDINNDGNLNIFDVIFLKKYILGNLILDNPQNADLNNDNSIDITDLEIEKNLIISK